MAKGAWYCKIEHKELKSFAHKKSVCVIEIICITVGNNQTVTKKKETLSDLEDLMLHV